MPEPQQLSINMRKSPKQGRAKASNDAILEATIQLLDKSPIDTITTNKIAERAGVSVGTLYQYYPNKMAILAAVARRARSATALDVIEQIESIASSTFEDTARQIVQILIKAYSPPHRERQLTLLMMLIRLEYDDPSKPIDKVAETMSAKIGSVLKIEQPNSEIASFVLVHAIMGVIRTALLQSPDFLGEQEFEDQVVNLILGLLGRQQERMS